VTDITATETPTAVEHAHAVVAHLTAKLAAIDDRIATNQKTRDALSYAAHAQADQKARKSLDDLVAERLKIDFDRENLTSALATAKAHLAAAQRDEAADEARADALEADKIFAALIATYELNDRARQALAATANRAAELCVALQKLGCYHPPSRAPFDAECRALSTCIQDNRLWSGQFDHRPLQHGAKIHSLKALAELWHASARGPSGWIGVRLGAPVTEAAE